MSPTRNPRRLLAACAVAAGLFGLVNAWLGDRPATLAVLAGTTAVLLVAFLIAWRRPDRTPLAMHLAATAASAALVLLSWWSGGLWSMYWYSFVLVPWLIASAVSAQAAVVWSVVSVLAALLATTNPLDIAPEIIVTPLERAIGGLALVGLASGFAISQRRAEDARLEEVHASIRARSEMLATISHEIRTPLHGIVGSITVLEESPLAGGSRDLLDAMRSSAKSLGRIIDDVLDLARLEAEKLPIRPEPCDLSRALAEIVELYGSDAARRGITVRAELGATPLIVIADEVRVRQIVSNLVANAVKFTTEGEVVVRARASREGELVSVELEVEDTGPGFPKGQLDRVFLAFEQPDAKLARLHGGSGLGLAIARSLVVRMGGTIRVVPDRARGACIAISLRLPAAEPASLPTQRVATTSASPREGRGTVLVVDDDPINRRVLRAMLERRGFAVRDAASGADASAHFASSALVLSDLHMPDETGVEMLERVRREALAPEVPFVAVTASVREEDRARCLEAGFVDVLAKPFRIEQLDDILARHLPTSSELHAP